MKKLIGELHRRSLWQVLGIYLAGSWVVLQVVGEIAESLSLPEWVQPFAIVALLIGFPIVMATAFLQGTGRRMANAPSETAGPAAEPDEEPRAAILQTAEKQSSVGDSGAHRLFTWRNAMTGGVLSFALLGVLMAGWLITRSMGIGPAATLVARGVLDERSPILLAEFASDDEQLAEVATIAFRSDLAESSVVRLADADLVAQGLQRMGRDPSTPLDADLARELAQREGIPAMLTGEVNSAAGGYLLSAQLVSAPTGDILLSERQTVSGDDQLIPAIDKLSNRIRERIGEGLGDLRADAPLEQVTTPSLDALRKYSQGMRAIELEGDDDRGLALLEEAVALDTAFAMAWRKMGQVLRNQRTERARMVTALTNAFVHRERLSEKERYQAVAAYYNNVTGDTDAAITAYENLLEIDPQNTTALNNLGVIYAGMFNHPRAAEQYRRTIAADSGMSLGYFNLAAEQSAMGDYDDARATLLLMEARFPGNQLRLVMSGWVEAAAGEYRAADSIFTVLQESDPGSVTNRARTSDWRANLAAARGLLDEAEELATYSGAASLERGALYGYYRTAMYPAWWDLTVRDDPSSAVRRLEEALAAEPMEQLDPLDRPLLQVASLYARAGEVSKAREHLAAFEEEVPDEFRRAQEPQLHRARAELALADGRYDEAINEFQQASDDLLLTGIGCDVCSLPGLALAYERAGQADSALAVLERYAAPRGSARMLSDSRSRGPVFERLGQLYDARGDLENAAKYYAMFVELWAEADEELQPRVRAAQARLEAILRERG